MINTIFSFKDFLLNESLSINKSVESFSDNLFMYLRNKGIGKYTIDLDIPKDLKISKLIIEIKQSDDLFFLGGIDLDKCYKIGNNWDIYIILSTNYSISTIYHEMNHVLQLVNKSKDEMMRKLNYITINHDNYQLYEYKFTEFLKLLYYASDTEIDSKITETYSILKFKILSQNISSNTYMNLLKQTEAWIISEMLINYKTSYLFNDIERNDINKFFYILEENKTKLDYITSNNGNFFTGLKSLIKSIFFDTKKIIGRVNKSSNFSYNPIKSDKYYDKFINRQGKKLKYKLIKLSSHFNLNGIDFNDTNL